MDSDYSFLWLFAVVPDEPPLHKQQPLPDSSWFIVDEPTQLPRALCRQLAHAGRAPPRNYIDGHVVTMITAVQPTPTVRATVAAVLLPRSRRVR